MKPGQYHYIRRGRFYEIYRCTEAGTDGCAGSVHVLDEPPFTDREQARRRVYELNGWKYTTKP